MATRNQSHWLRTVTIGIVVIVVGAGIVSTMGIWREQAVQAATYDALCRQVEHSEVVIEALVKDLSDIKADMREVRTRLEMMAGEKGAAP